MIKFPKLVAYGNPITKVCPTKVCWLPNGLRDKHIGDNQSFQPFIRRGLPNAVKRSRQKYHCFLFQLIASFNLPRLNSMQFIAFAPVL